MRLLRESRSSNLPQNEWRVTEVVYKNWVREEIPQHRFAVSAYGLPEIDPEIKRPWPMWLWCVMVAAVAVAAMCLFRWLARRRKAVS
jgi:hypothetical protein